VVRPGISVALTERSMMDGVELPADGHVHSEWSWDARDGAMERTCVRAVELGLPAVAFTEHADVTRWLVLADDLGEHDHLRRFLASDGTVVPPPLNVEGYLESLQRCRDRFPQLTIVSGVELGEPHWHVDLVQDLLAAGRFDRVLGSLHSLPIGAGFSEPPYLYRHRPPHDVVRDYLAETPRLIRGCDVFALLAHIDYPLRYWPSSAGSMELRRFEDEFRHALRALADTDRALEVNTAGQLRAEVVCWWREEGGTAVTFGSDAHDPTELGRGFSQAAAMVEAHGFKPGRHPHDTWRCSG
jgi:histidinol-phosphatase (PHP family)